MLYADHDQRPKRGIIRGTVYSMTFPLGGGRARTTLPMDLDEAIRFFDPFQHDDYTPAPAQGE